MSKKKVIVLAVGVLAVGAMAAIAAKGHRGGWHDGRGGHEGMGRHGMGGDGDMPMRRGMFGGDMTKEAYDGEVRARFARTDKNNDGVLDTAEIEAGLQSRQSQWRERFGRGGPGGRDGAVGGGAMGDRLIGRFDTNRDGKVTKDEFIASVKKRFAEADLDRDGKITDADLPPMMRGRGALSGEQSAGGMGRGGFRGGQGGGQSGGMFGWLDVKPENGAITEAAALAAAGREFDRFDRNKDAVVDKADFDALRKEMVEYGAKRFVHRNGGSPDGRVTREQFTAKAAERFAELDANNDGRIERREMRGHGFGGHGMDGRNMEGRGGMRERMGGEMRRGGGPGPDAGGPPPKQ